MGAQDEQKHRPSRNPQSAFQSLHPINTRNPWRDTQYHEIRNILGNIWMTLIFGVPATGEVSLDSVQTAWEKSPRHHLGLKGREGSKKLLNILKRFHRIVCEKYSAYEGLEMGLRPDFQPLNDLSGLIYEYVRTPEASEGCRPRGPGIRCTCRLRPSAATAEEKNLRIKEIRKLLCVKWATLLKKGGHAGPSARVLNEMLLRLWEILCSLDPPIYVPRVRCRRHIRNYPKPLKWYR